jgi:hypothetical protein
MLTMMRGEDVPLAHLIEDCAMPRDISRAVRMTFGFN